MMRCYFYVQKQLSDETNDWERGGKRQPWSTKGIRAKGSRNERRRLFTKIQLWNCWVTGKVKLYTSSLSPSSSSSPTSPTPRSTACPHPSATITTSKHTYTLTQPSIVIATERIMRHIVTPQSQTFVIGSHKKTNQITVRWRAFDAISWFYHIKSQMGLTLWQVPVFIRWKRRFSATVTASGHRGIWWICPHCVYLHLFLQHAVFVQIDKSYPYVVL